MRVDAKYNGTAHFPFLEDTSRFTAELEEFARTAMDGV